MTRTTMLTAALLALLPVAVANATTERPYAGLEGRDIAGLSSADIDDLLAGRGWGFALPAELNGYPGPAHVLEAADELELTPEQRAAIEEIFEQMNAEARALGAEYVAAEAALSTAFADGSIDTETLTALTAEAARIEAELRATHLAAHLEVTPLLTRHQIMTYNRLRGYQSGSGHGDHGGHGGHD